MIQEDGFESRWVLQQSIDGILSKCSECCVGGGKDGVLLTHISKCRYQSSSFDCRDQRREAWLTHEGAHQILGRKKNRIYNVHNTVARHHVSRGHVNAPVDCDLARFFHTDAQIVTINSLDNVITQVSTKYFTTDDMVKENVLEGLRIFEESLGFFITKYGESLFTMRAKRRKCECLMVQNVFFFHEKRFTTHLVRWSQYGERTRTS
jgi:hypothetical protein